MYLRTTTLNTNSTMLNYMTQQENDYNKLAQQATSGIKVSRPSDDASAARGILNINTQLSQLQGYLDTMAESTQELKALDDALNSLNTQITNVTDIATQAANGTYSNENMAEMKTQIDTILETIVGISNSTYNGTYIFSGTNVDTKTYSVTKDANGVITEIKYNGSTKDSERKVTISDGVTKEINAQGDRVFGSYDSTKTPLGTGLFGTLMELSTALGNNDSTAVGETLTGLDTAFQTALSTRTKFANVSNMFDQTTASISETMSNLTEYRSDLRDTDLAEALTKLASAKSALQATYSISSQLLGKVSLMDYM